MGTSLAVHWLRRHSSNAGDAGLIPGQGTGGLHAVWCSQKKKKITGPIQRQQQNQTDLKMNKGLE